MPSISPLIARVFDDPHANARNGKRVKPQPDGVQGTARKTSVTVTRLP